MNINACYSHNSDDWKTPTKIYNQFIETGYIDCFPYKAKYNEFEKDYYKQKLFVNPPFSKMKEVAKWVEKQYLFNGCEIALLIPARTDTKYFHDLLKLQPEIVFIKGRLHYNESKSAPFPTILLKFNNIDLPIYRTWEQ